MKMKTLVLVGSTVLGAAALAAAAPPAKAAPRKPRIVETRQMDPIELFRIEPIMAKIYSKEIALTEAQREFVVQQLDQTQTAWRDLQARSETEKQKLQALIGTPGVTEAQLFAQLDRLLDLEREIKHVNLGCALRVRQKLTAAQVAKLREMDIPPPPPPPMPPSTPSAAESSSAVPPPPPPPPPPPANR
jgi:hypothetical protein